MIHTDRCFDPAALRRVSDGIIEIVFTPAYGYTDTANIVVGSMVPYFDAALYTPDEYKLIQKGYEVIQ